MNKTEISYINGPKVEILGEESFRYRVEMFDNLEGTLIHSSEISNNMWTRANREWYTDWRIVITNLSTKEVQEERFNLKGKRVFIRFESSSLGDTLAWIPYIEIFRKKHECEIICSTFWNNLFIKEYPDIIFIAPNRDLTGVYARYDVGWFNNVDRNPVDVRLVPLQKTATSILGLPYEEIRPKVTVKKPLRYEGPSPKGKYICIATQSTAQAKYWNNPGAWERVVDHFKKIGYEVYDIDKYATFGIEGQYNSIPENAINDTGEKSIEDRIWLLKGADLFIGLGSGLSWLAWAVNIPVVLISGFSKPYAEFSTGIYRAFKKDVCNGCFNDTAATFDRGDWNWCPRNQDFICTRAITPEEVINGGVEVLVRTGIRENYEDMAGVNQVIREMIWWREYERLFKPKDGDVIVDIGANFGLFSMVSTMGVDIEKCYCVEPLPSNVEYIKCNRDRLTKDPKKYEIVEAAIASKKGKADLDITSGWSPVLLEHSPANHEIVPKISINTLTFQDLIESYEIKHIDILKMDCEGGEFDILGNEWNLHYIKNNVENITGELHLNVIEGRERLWSLLENVMKCGFDLRIYSIDGINITWAFIDESKKRSKNWEESMNYYQQVLFYGSK